VCPHAVNLIASSFPNPALAKISSVSCKEVSGAGTPDAPGPVASMRPVRKGIIGPPQLEMLNVRERAIKSATRDILVLLSEEYYDRIVELKYKMGGEYVVVFILNAALLVLFLLQPSL
jgi:hypothetical protein